MPKSDALKIKFSADEMQERFGGRAAMEAANWANAAYDRGDMKEYEFWQWVVMDLNARNVERWHAKKVAH